MQGHINADEDDFTLLFSDIITFISFSCLLVLAMTYSIIMSKNGESIYP